MNSLGFPLPLQLPKTLQFWGHKWKYIKKKFPTRNTLPFSYGVDDVYKDNLNASYFILGQLLNSATINYGLVPFWSLVLLKLHGHK